MATIRRLLKIISLFCKSVLSKRLYSAKETYNFKEPADRSHPKALFTRDTYRAIFETLFFLGSCTAGEENEEVQDSLEEAESDNEDRRFRLRSLRHTLLDLRQVIFCVSLYT